MTTLAVAAIGVALSGPGGVIAEVKNLTGPNLQAGSLDATTHDSVGYWKEKIPSFLDGGEISVDINYIPTNATQSALVTAMAARTISTYSLAWSDTGHTTWSFSAFVKGFQVKAPVLDLLTATVTFEITGAPTLA